MALTTKLFWEDLAWIVNELSQERAEHVPVCLHAGYLSSNGGACLFLDSPNQRRYTARSNVEMTGDSHRHIGKYNGSNFPVEVQASPRECR